MTSVREYVCNNSKKRKKSCFLKSEKNVKYVFSNTVDDMTMMTMMTLMPIRLMIKQSTSHTIAVNEVSQVEIQFSHRNVNMMRINTE